MKEGDCLETQLVQRDFDKHWELIGKFVSDVWSYKNQDEKYEEVISYKWITLAVYPFIMEEVAIV